MKCESSAYVLADNKLALNAGWDEDLLAEELQALLADDLGFDIGVTGFSIPEIDGLIEGLTPEEPGDPEDDWLPEPGPARCRAGRCLAARAAPADLRRCARPGRRRPADGWRDRRGWSSPIRPTT